MPANKTRPRLSLAGTTITDPITITLAYLEERFATVMKYDTAAGTAAVITRPLLDATRGPWQMNSRISEFEGRWLLDRSRDAPWSRVPTDADLVDADPAEDGELFDEAHALWMYFWRLRPKGIATAKLSMILHLTRPALFPLLDNRLLSIYRNAIGEARLEYPERSLESDDLVMAWIPIRRDLMAGLSSLNQLRSTLLEHPSESVRSAMKALNNLRLLDILLRSLA